MESLWDQNRCLNISSIWMYLILTYLLIFLTKKKKRVWLGHDECLNLSSVWTYAIWTCQAWTVYDSWEIVLKILDCAQTFMLVLTFSQKLPMISLKINMLVILSTELKYTFSFYSVAVFCCYLDQSEESYNWVRWNRELAIRIGSQGFCHMKWWLNIWLGGGGRRERESLTLYRTVQYKLFSTSCFDNIPSVFFYTTIPVYTFSWNLSELTEHAFFAFRLMAFSLSNVSAREWFHKTRERVKPWGDFLNTKNFKMPTSVAPLPKRIIKNIDSFQGNYLFVFLGLFFFCVWVIPLCGIWLESSVSQGCGLITDHWFQGVGGVLFG